MPPEAREQLEANNQMDQLKDQLITQEVLYQEALGRSLHTDEKVKTQIALAEREALVAALLNDVAEEAATDEALKAWYDEHQVQFRKSEAKFAQIVLDSEEDAKAVVADVAGGADFGFAWGVGGWLLTPFLQKLGSEAGVLYMRVAKEIKTTFASHYTEEVSLAEALDVETLQAYQKKATGQKYLIEPQRG